MASSRRTFDTDSITLRTVYAKNGNNTNIPALRALTADGSGGTTWRIPSSFGTVPSFNQIITDAGTFTADLSYNIFRLTSGEGIGMTSGPPGSNQTYLYSKAFGQIDVSGADSLYSYSNGVLRKSFQIAATNGLQLRSDPQRNILYIDGPLTTTISSGYYAYNKFLVVPTISTFTSNIPTSLGNFLIANSPSSQITLAGIGDVLLSSFYSTNTVFFQVSSYSAKEFLTLSSIVNGFNSTVNSTLNNVYVTKSDFSTGTTSVSTVSYSNASSVTSTIYGISSFFVTQFNTLTGLINARALIVQLNSNVANFQTSISSFSTNYIDLTQYISSTQGLPNQVSSIITINNVSSIYLFGGTLYNFSTGSILYDQSDVSTISTATGASISTTSNALTNQIIGSYRSTTSTVDSLGTLGYVSTASLFSTIVGLGTFGYVSSLSLVSTVNGLGTVGYISTSYLNDVLASTTQGVNDNFGSFGYISSLTLQSSLQSTSKGIIDNLGSFNYISTQSFDSTLQSTVQGITDYLGFYGYVSTQGVNTILTSTILGLGTLGYTSTQTLNEVLISSTDAFNSNIANIYISTLSLVSTTEGLGTFGYISTASLLSTTSSLINILSTGSKTSIRSSILYNGSNGTFETSAIPGEYSMFFRTVADLSLAPFSSFITANSQITLDLNQNILFPQADSNGIGNIKYISTYILCGFLPMPDATFYDPIILQFSNLSNTYMKNITIPLDTAFVQGSYTSTLDVRHLISAAFYIEDSTSDSGFINSTITVSNSLRNSIFVTILN
jgi:hypothetical protein